MNLREADDAARSTVPIVWHDPHSDEDITFRRIITAGYRYTENGIKEPYVELLDFRNKSTVTVNPENCRLAISLVQHPL